jgi:hypothetical protein
MRKSANLLLMLCLATLCSSPVASAAPYQVTFGRGIRRLQDLVDRRYGKGRIDVTRDYVGARSGDIDPWFWVGERFGGVRVKTLKRDPKRNRIGWYIENGGQAQIPDGGGLLLSGQVRLREEAPVSLPSFRTRFGFYVEAIDGTQSHLGLAPGQGNLRRFYTNRKLNDCGPNGSGAVHPPLDGDCQALVFDVSRWAGPGVWLVCFEDSDTGGTLAVEDDDAADDDLQGDDDGEGDDHDNNGTHKPNEDNPRDKVRRSKGCNNDYDDAVFEVRADGATPAHSLSFGALKVIYR